MTYMPVSYTHLDVYKRQGEEGICSGCGVATLSISYYDLGVATGKMAVKILTGESKVEEMPIEYAPQFTKKYNPANAEALGITTVSYTHLDVYKRQVVYGNLKEDAGTVDAPIGRDPKDRKKMAVTQLNSKPARTHWTVLERFGNFTYIACKLETGRTHQIRVHMASIGHPLAGDAVYGPRTV